MEAENAVRLYQYHPFFVGFFVVQVRLRHHRTDGSVPFPL